MVRAVVRDGRIGEARCDGRQLSFRRCLSARAFRAGPASMTGGVAILIVDDEPDICEEFAEFLDARGNTVDVASTVEQACALLQSGKTYAMVLTDFRLGNGRGTDVVAAARAALGNKVLIIVITGQLTAETEQLVRQSGADKALAKPVDPMALLALVPAGAAG